MISNMWFVLGKVCILVLLIIETKWLIFHILVEALFALVLNTAKKSYSSFVIVCFGRKEWAVQGSGEEGIANSSVVKPHIGGLYSTPDVQSLWSFD